MHWAIVMAGGSGTRFWPLSRAGRPKQLLPLAGGEDSLLKKTVQRVLPLVPLERVIVVTAARLAKATRAELPGLPKANLLAEPLGRNTAPCVAWGALAALRADPDATLAVLAADHHMADEDGWRDAAAKALSVAADGSLVTMGIEPTRPETGYGWLELGDETSPGVRVVKRFVEKPDAALAQTFLEQKRHLWNSGQFFFRADAVLAQIHQHLPGLGAALGLGHKRRLADAAIRRLYPTLPSISFDNGVMEKAENVRVVAASVGWSDVGSYETAFQLADKDEEGNALASGAIAIDSRRTFVRAPEGKTVAILGVEDLIVVDTGDALLVMPRARSQDVKHVVAELHRLGLAERL